MLMTKPIMGWNSWNTFGREVNEDTIRRTADRIVELGLNTLGYEYVIIDDCWEERKRDKNGRLVPNKKTFPSGIKALADYVHSKGLKFGIYSAAGLFTCEKYPGSCDYEFIDARTFAEWGVDFLKYDSCVLPTGVARKTLYRRMGLALANCGRDIPFAVATGGWESTHEWARSTGGVMWRSTQDVADCWKSICMTIQQQLNIIKDTYRGTEYCKEGSVSYAGGGFYNDMDMLVVGMNNRGNCAMGGCTYEEYKTQFSAWALMQSPLIIGCDLMTVDEQALGILTNKEVIAVDRDECSAAPFFVSPVYPIPISENGMPYVPVPMVARLMSNGDVVLGAFNLSDNKCTEIFNVTQLSLPRTIRLHARDLWTGEECDIDDEPYFFRLEPHSCRLLRLKLMV